MALSVLQLFRQGRWDHSICAGCRVYWRADTPAATITASIDSDTTTLLPSTIIGASDIWAQSNNRHVQAGSLFDAAQYHSDAWVVVPGPTVATTLFGHNFAAALGQRVWINHAPFQIIGGMQSYGQQLDNSAVMPPLTGPRGRSRWRRLRRLSRADAAGRPDDHVRCRRLEAGGPTAAAYWDTPRRMLGCGLVFARLLITLELLGKWRSPRVLAFKESL